MVLFMNEDKKWMLMTYYCPTHGDIVRIEPLEKTREKTSKTFLKKRNSLKSLIQQDSIKSENKS